MNRYIPGADTSGLKETLDLPGGYKLVATDRMGFDDAQFELFDKNGKSLGYGAGPGSAFTLAAKLIPKDDPDRDQIIFQVQTKAQQMQTSLFAQVNKLEAANKALYEPPYSNSDFTVTKTPDPNNKDLFTYTLSGPNGFTYDLGTSSQYEIGNGNALAALIDIPTTDKRLIGWLAQQNSLESSLKSILQNSGPPPSVKAPEKVDKADDPSVKTADPAANAAATTTTVAAGGEAAPVAKDPATPSSTSGVPGSNKTGLTTSGAATTQNAQKFKAQEDWRVRLSLAPGAKYLYKGIPKGEAGILAPLQDTDGVIFPYTPSIAVSYNAAYEPTDVTHSNYKIFSYKNSAVDTITITGDFTAQDTTEANYLLAVIHFFRSVTKMFYGLDQNPNPGVPPPLCYLSGLGAFQFDWHPLVITNFTYTLPTEVDYIRAMGASGQPGVNTGSGQTKGNSTADSSATRMAGSGIGTGAVKPDPKFTNSQSTSSVTYVPTKMAITITASPIITRNDVSNNFSLKKYATGELLRGSQRNSGGFW